MKDLIARNPKQLDICLRMAYAENVKVDGLHILNAVNGATMKN